MHTSTREDKSQEWYTVERVADRFRSEAVNDDWISACQRMAGAGLKGWVNSYRTRGWKAIGTMSRWNIGPCPLGATVCSRAPQSLCFRDRQLEENQTLVLNPPDWGRGVSDGEHPKSVAPVLTAPRNELPVNKFREACSIHDATPKAEQPA